MRSFLLLFLGMAVVAIAISALPTAADLHKNQQSELCVLIDGRELLRGGTDECVLDAAAIGERFLLYFTLSGGALLGPFGLYVVLLGVKMGLTGAGRGRGREEE